MQRYMQQIDLFTGEVLEHGCMVYVPQRPKFTEAFVMAFQDGLVKLATDRTMTGEQWRVLAYLMGRLDFENYIHIPQTSICAALGMRAPHVSRAIAALVKRGVLIRGPKVGQVGTLRLSPETGWRGRVKSFQEERAKRLGLVHSTKEAIRGKSPRERP